METVLKKVGALPALTWNWLGVNGSDLAVSLPASGPARQAVPPAFAAVGTGLGPETAAFAERNATDLQIADVPEHTEKTLTFAHTLRAGEALIDVTCIRARAGSRVTAVFSWQSGDGAACTHGALIKVIAEKGAEVRLVLVQLLGASSRHFADVGLVLGEDASGSVTAAEIGGDPAVHGCLALLDGNGSRFTSDLFYFGDAARKLDLSVIARHRGRRTESGIRACGSLFGRSDKIYRGTIDFLRGAARSKGHETEETLLFSPEARGRTVPLILCREEDVEGQHAATIGRIDEKKLFYLKTRGLREEDAKQLLVEAQIRSVLAGIPDPALRSAAAREIERRMDHE